MTKFLTLLRDNRNYRYTWMGQVVSEIGDHFNNIAVFSLAVQTTHSGLVVSGVLLARAIPAVLAGPLAGVTLDRLNRKQVMIASDLIRAVVALAFIFTVKGHSTAALRPERAADAGIAVFHQRALVDSAHHRYRRGIAHRQLAHPDHAVDHARRGAFLGGASVMQFGYKWAFVGNSLSFVFSALCISRLFLPGADSARRDAISTRRTLYARGTSTSKAYATCARYR